MNVNPATAKHTYEYDGKKYYFCCAGCVEKFKASPQGYLNKPKSSGLVTLGMPTAPKAAPTQPTTIQPAQKSMAAASTPAYVCPMCPEVHEAKPGACPSCGMALERDTPLATTRTEYTCPMHPEIVRTEPGSCPICGMTLEPRTVTATQEENPELRDMTRRFWVSVVLTVPLLAIAMGSMLWPHFFMGDIAAVNSDQQVGIAWSWILAHELLRLQPWLEFLLATPVVLWCGWPFFQRFWTSLVNRSPNMFTLIGLGTGVAYVYSVVATVAPPDFSRVTARHGRISRRLL